MTLSSNPQGVYCPNHDYESASAAYCPWCRAEKAEAERDRLPNLHDATKALFRCKIHRIPMELGAKQWYCPQCDAGKESAK